MYLVDALHPVNTRLNDGAGAVRAVRPPSFRAVSREVRRGGYSQGHLPLMAW